MSAPSKAPRVRLAGELDACPASLLRDSQADGYAGLTGSLTETITALPTALSSWFWGGGTAAPAAASSSSSARPALASLTTPGRP